MKILYYTNYFPNPELITLGIFVYRRVKSLIETGIEVKVITPNNIIKKKKLFDYKNNYNLKNIGLELNLTVEVVNFIKIPFINFNLLPIKKIKNIFVKENFNLLHIHSVWDGYVGFLLKKKFNIPYILTVHGSDIHTIPFESPKNKIFTLNILENADKVIFVSNYLLEKAKEFGYSTKNGVVINNGVDLNKFRIIKNNPIKLKTNNEKIVGFIGDLDPIKRANKLPELFFKIKNKIDNVKFLIAGTGSLDEQIKNDIKNFGIENDTIITGNINPDEVPNYMNNLDVLIFISLKEGFGCVAIEANACGVSVVATNNSAIPESVGDGGILVSDGDGWEERIVSNVINILNNPISSDYLEKRAQKFAWEEIVKKEINVYKIVIGKINDQ